MGYSLWDHASELLRYAREERDIETAQYLLDEIAYIQSRAEREIEPMREGYFVIDEDYFTGIGIEQWREAGKPDMNDWEPYMEDMSARKWRDEPLLTFEEWCVSYT